MKRINKSETEPQALQNYRIDSNGINYTWASFQNPYKRDYREYLLKEQGYICAYCMQSISLTTIKIEHLNPRHNCTEEEKLNNHNMVAVCLGITDAEIHCDTKRGNLKPSQQFLSIFPTQSEPNCEELTVFSGGEIESINNDENIFDDLNNKLNLNCKSLVRKRNATEEGFIEGLILKASENNFEWTTDLLNEELNKILQVNINFDDRKFNEFCLIEANLLRRKIELLENVG